MPSFYSTLRTPQSFHGGPLEPSHRRTGTKPPAALHPRMARIRLLPPRPTAPSPRTPWMLTLGGNRPRAQGMRKLSPGSPRPNCLGKLRALRVSLPPLPPPHEPRRDGCHRARQGGGPQEPGCNSHRSDNHGQGGQSAPGAQELRGTRGGLGARQREGRSHIPRGRRHGIRGRGRRRPRARYARRAPRPQQIRAPSCSPPVRAPGRGRPPGALRHRCTIWKAV